MQQSAHSHPTQWALVRSAAAGEPSARERFACDYLHVIRGFLSRRWQGTAAVGHVDDATQEVFVDFLRADGVLNRVERSETPSFRAFLFGVTRNVARRFEARMARKRERSEALEFDAVHGRDASQSQVFDRSWALECIDEARGRLADAARGERQHRRIALLEMRYGENMPIRAIAKAWGQDATHLHHEHATARREFHRALRATLASRGLRGDLDQGCRMLMGLIAP